MFTKMRTVSLLALIMASLSYASIAEATKFSFPGTICEQQGYGGNIYYDGGAAINGNSSSAITFYCPILRVGLTTSNITDIVVTVYDNSRSASVRCRALSCTNNSTGCTTTSWVSSGSSATGYITLPALSIAGYTNGFAQVECEVPQGSNVYNFYYND
ncbi:MAG: hypothetical protein JW795_21030 [Chitinivibrionales bacterium]|nr:hypothetical protein [Chitinivibrionales bacterium]